MTIKEKIAILGGSMNPISKGHIELAKFVLSKTDVKKVWVMPCFGHILKSNLANSLCRYDMCRLACLNEENINVSPYEIIHKLNGSVFDLFDTLCKDPKMSNYEFSFIIGADNVVIFDQWKNAEQLKKIAKFIIVPRQGIIIPEDIVWHKNLPNIFLNENNPIMKVSATEIRKMLYKWWNKTLSAEEEIELKNKIDEKVLKYIGHHSLYKE